MVIAQRNNSNLFDINFYYPGRDLGVSCNGKNTKFKIWVPDADKVEVLIFENENDRNNYRLYSMEKDIQGTWKLNIGKNLEGFYYLFKIIRKGHSHFTVDPYAKAVGTNSELGLIVNLENTNPEGWEKDSRVKLEKPVDAVIYELHVKDFSVSEESGMKNKGKYLAFTEEGTTNSRGFKTGLEHLKDLGITHVHLLPVFDFATVDDNDKNDYNWGYDPLFYNTPEGSYASNPADDSRIIEFKKLVKKLHDNDIGVIMDVVYNHTYYTQKSSFEKIAPGYFYRKLLDNKFADGSGCGKEIATERPMVRKFIIDSLCYWTEEYHIDGFRFDLMGLMDKETMRQVEKTLHNIDPSILLYGEPWYALPPQLDSSRCMYKGAQAGMKIAVFNDKLRGTIKGDNNGHGRGFVTGNVDNEFTIKSGVVGEINYNKKLYGFTEKASETINYVSCHDDLSLWDKLLKLEDINEDKKIKMDKMAQAIIFTSQGIPFLYAGEEFLRTKYKNDNSYNAGDEINKLKWERKSKYYEVYKYYQGLIRLRNHHPAFRMNEPEMIRKHLKFISTSPNTVGFKLVDYANGDEWKTIVVLYNPHPEWRHFYLKEKKNWGIVVDDERAGIIPFNVFTADNVNVPPISVMVLYNIVK